jgi:glycosyltransferase involved in cell wall biosynthesis
MEQPLVSVLMTVYNREKYIAEAIESVISSSYQNWELIIVDDRSSDNSVAIANTYVTNDSRINVYINAINLGDYPNRNKAASYAKGKYLKYLDSDDLIYSHGLEVMVTAMEQYPEATLGIGWNKNELLKPYPVEVASKMVFMQQFIGTGFFAIGPTGTIINREKFQNEKGLCNSRYTGDFDSWLKFSQKKSVVIFQPGLVWWRQHEGQEFNSGQDPSKYLKSTTDIMIKYIQDRDSPLSQSDRKQAMLIMKQRHARMFLYHVFKFRFAYALKYLKYSSIKIADLLKGLKKSSIKYNFENHI